MAHLPGYPTDVAKWPDGKGRSQEKQRDSVIWQVRQRSEPTYVSTACILNYSNTQYNNCLI